MKAEDMSLDEIQEILNRYEELAEEVEDLKRSNQVLKEEAQKFILAMENHWQEIENVKDMPPDDGMDSQTHRSKLLGTYQGSNLGLKMQIQRFKHLLSIL